MRILLLFSLALLFSCNSVPSNKQTLRLSLHSEPPTLDPRKTSDNVSSLLTQGCFEGLTILDSAQQPQLALAERYVLSEDQKTYTFYLRKALWWDETPVTAHDFEVTWKTTLDPSFPAPMAYQLYCIKNAKRAKEGKCSIDEICVKALDDTTLRVELEHPSPFFLKSLASSPFLPIPAHYAAKEYTDQFVGNGPFKLKSWRHQNELIFEKNSTYWNRDQIKLDEIHFSIVEDENTNLSLFESGKLDWLGYPFTSVPLDALPILHQKNRIELFPICSVYYYMFNTKEPPFDNVLIRRAFAMAIDRQGIVTHVTQAGQTPATGLVPPSLWKEERHYFSDHNLKEARKLLQEGLDELGLTLQSLPQIRLVYNRTEGHHKIAQAIQQQWFEAFGIRVILENLEWKVFLDQMRSGQFQVARMGWISTVDDPLSFLDQFCNHTDSRWNNEDYNALIHNAEETLDPGERMHLLKEAEALLIAEMPIAPIYYYTGSYMKQSRVHGMHPMSTVNIDFRTVFLDDK